MEAFLEMGNVAVHSFLLGDDITAFVDCFELHVHLPLHCPTPSPSRAPGRSSCRCWPSSSSGNTSSSGSTKHQQQRR
eukprot:3496277-Pyramimonas_sp.AAC.1